MPDGRDLHKRGGQGFHSLCFSRDYDCFAGMSTRYSGCDLVKISRASLVASRPNEVSMQPLAAFPTSRARVQSIGQSSKQSINSLLESINPSKNG